MRIGNTYLSPASAVDRLDATRRAETTARKPVRSAAEDASDLLALSTGVGMHTVLESAGADRRALIDKLRQACSSGAYQPSPERIAERLLDLGFDPPAPEVP